MNEMYKYLRDHNYISRNENKDTLRQQELSKIRAECIANKYDSLTDELQQENKQLKELIDTILNLPFFKNECPLSICFENNSKEEKAQNIFSDEYCENNCSDDYKDCWLKYFKELQKNK